MATFRCPEGGKPLPRPAVQPMALTVYTPTPDGFERFLREAIGLTVDMPGGDSSGQVSIPWDDSERRSQKGHI